MIARFSRLMATLAVGSITLLASSVTQAAILPGVFTINIAPDGLGNVVATGSGFFNLAASSGSSLVSQTASMTPSNNSMNLGPTASTAVSNYFFFLTATGPSGFGTGATYTPSSGSGSPVGFVITSSLSSVAVPVGYTSGSALSDTDTFSGKTLSSIGLTAGSTYSWVIGSGSSANTININVASVPEPASLSLLGIGSVGLLRRRRGTHV